MCLSHARGIRRMARHTAAELTCTEPGCPSLVPSHWHAGILMLSLATLAAKDQGKLAAVLAKGEEIVPQGFEGAAPVKATVWASACQPAAAAGPTPKPQVRD